MTRRTTWMGVGLLAAAFAVAVAQTAVKPDAVKSTSAKAAPVSAKTPAQSAPAKAPAQTVPTKSSIDDAKAITFPPVVPAGPPPIPLNRGIIVLDAAHGGTDSGSRISDSLVEKDVTLGLAFKLRSLLTARGFTVIMTRDSEASQTGITAPTPILALDDRAGLANHAHAVACLLLHATGSGQGVHLYSSELEPASTQPTANPWLTAQAPWVAQSQHLEKSLGVALKRSEINLVMSRASIRPLDSLTCPALVVELAPNGDDAESVNDGEYQQKVATALAGALLNWKNEAQPPDPEPFVSASAGVKP